MENPEKDDYSETKKPNDLIGGFLIGFLSFQFANLVIPKTLRSFSQHDILLSILIGVTYSLLTAFWFPRMGHGGSKNMLRRLAVGLLVGCMYSAVVCSFPNFIIALLVSPSLLSAILLNLLLKVSTNEQLKLASIARDSMNGLIAGLLFGVSYALIINLVILIFHVTRIRHFEDMSLAKYYQVIALGGPIALGISSCLFFYLLRRAFEERREQIKPNARRFIIQLFLIIASIVLASDKNLIYNYVIPLARWAFHQT